VAGQIAAQQALQSTATRRFTVIAFAFLCICGVLSANAPIRLSIAIVFLFAGPHNLSEARYFLTRLPARAGRLKVYFACSVFGTVGLSTAYAALPRLAAARDISPALLAICYAVWNTTFLLWIAGLAEMRCRQAPRRHWPWLWPAVLAIAGCAWFQPLALPVLLAYLHPLMGLWILDREIEKSRPEWTTAYRCLLLTIPVIVAFIWTVPSATMDGSSELQQATRGIGAFLFPGASLGKLLATHVFLELVHYGVWLLAVPLANGKVWSHRFNDIPLMKRRHARPFVRSLIVCAAFVVATLWICFALDYGTTREVYFAVATVHVLAEVPLLLRLL